jgi:hypothetical protein
MSKDDFCAGVVPGWSASTKPQLKDRLRVIVAAVKRTIIFKVLSCRPKCEREACLPIVKLY